jgi:hypothetical protein
MDQVNNLPIFASARCPSSAKTSRTCCRGFARMRLTQPESYDVRVRLAESPVRGYFLLRHPYLCEYCTKVQLQAF